MLDFDLYPYVPGVSEKFGIHPTTSQTQLNNESYIDFDLFYIYLADAMMTVPCIVDFVKAQYETNKFVYFEKASNNPQYHATLISDGRIEREALSKRAFGILLAAKEDDRLRTKICDRFINWFSPLRKMKKPFPFEAYDKYQEQYFVMVRNNNLSTDANRGFKFFAAYVIDHYLGINNNKYPGVVVAKLQVISTVLNGERANNDATTKKIDAINERDYIRTPALFRDFKPLIQCNEDIISTLTVLRRFDESVYDAFYKGKQRFDAIYEYLNIPETKEEQIRFEMLIRNLMDSLALAGKDIVTLIGNQTITEVELTRIYKLVARNYLIEQNGSSRLIDIRPCDYFYAIVIYQIAKAMIDDRDFYYKNSSESRFFEMQTAEKENTELKYQLKKKQQEIIDLQQQIATQAAQIEELRCELLKDIKDAARDATKPMLAEISLLNNRITELQNRAEESDRQQSELFRLREFVFNMQQGSDIQIEEVPLEKLIDGKRIYVFGGHINWRNKLKQKYPKLEVLDGHNVSFDEQKLLGADMVLMNTSNMSHALYYKIIDVLRKNNVPFDYLGKYHNPELLEKEIAEVLLRQRN